MNFSAPFIARPVATTLLTLGIVLAGLLAFTQLPVAPLPQVDFPTISVQASLPGASPETMASSVAQPLERQFAQIQFQISNYLLTDLKLPVAWVPVAWVSLQLLKGLFNVPGGRASDRFGRRRVLAIAWLLYAVTYAGFGFAPSWEIAWLLIVPYALHYGLAEGGQRALLTDLVPRALRGRAFGIQLAIEGAFILPANVGFGHLVDRYGAQAAFSTAAACAALAAILLLAIVPDARPHSDPA